MKLWAGRFQKETDTLVNDFNSSITFDARMYRQDIEGSMAHAAMLGKQGLHHLNITYVNHNTNRLSSALMIAEQRRFCNGKFTPAARQGQRHTGANPTAKEDPGLSGHLPILPQRSPAEAKNRTVPVIFLWQWWCRSSPGGRG